MPLPGGGLERVGGEMAEKSASRSVRVFARVEGIGGVIGLVYAQVFVYGRFVGPAGVRPEGR